MDIITRNTKSKKNVKQYTDYLNQSNEMNTRKAAANFVFKDSDIAWARNLILKCIKQEYANIIKYNVNRK